MRTETWMERPTRVMVSPTTATTPDLAKSLHGIEPDVVFLRADGWSLGAPWGLDLDAWDLWAGEWVAQVVLPRR